MSVKVACTVICEKTRMFIKKIVFAHSVIISAASLSRYIPVVLSSARFCLINMAAA